MIQGLTSFISYVDALHFAIDGNFHFNQKAPRSDPNDFPLTHGAGYFVHGEDFKKFLAKAPPPRKEVSATALMRYLSNMIFSLQLAQTSVRWNTASTRGIYRASSPYYVGI